MFQLNNILDIWWDIRHWQEVQPTTVWKKKCENVQQPTPIANSNNLKCHSVLIGKLDDEEEQKVASIGRNWSDRTNTPSFSNNDRFLNISEQKR